MDKDDSANLDVEYKRYLQILKPYLGQLLDPEDIEICNAWIHRLSDCDEIEKGRRNKYLFTLCYQLANGVLKHPFSSRPPPSELPVLYEEANSDDSFSEAETHNTSCHEHNFKAYSNNTKTLLDNIYQSARSEINATTNELETNLADPTITNLSNSPSEHQPSACNSIVTKDVFYPDFFKDISELAHSEDNVYSRVNNLVEKLREMKRENTMLHAELKTAKEERSTKDLNRTKTEIIKVAVDCSTNTKVTFDEVKATDKRLACNCELYTCEPHSGQEKLIQSNELEMEPLRRQHQAEIARLRSSIQREIQDAYDKKLQSIKDEYDLSIVNIKSKTDVEIDRLKSSLNEINAEKENQLALKNQEINRLKLELEEVKNHNSELINSFIKAKSDYGPEKVNEKALEFEKRLYKIEKAKNKSVKAYQAQLANLQCNKNLLDSSFHLQLLKQRTELISDFAQENQKHLLMTVEKLEGKYKNIVANVQAAAIQRRIQDQIALEAIIQTVFTSCDGSARGSDSGQDVFKTKTMRSVSKDSRNLLASLQSCHRDGSLFEKVAGLEDSLPSGFCMDEIKLEELFERVHIPQKDTDTAQSIP